MAQIIGRSSQVAEVTDKGQLLTKAVTLSGLQDLNEQGRIYSIELEITPTGADDYFIYLKNVGVESIVFNRFTSSCSVLTDVAVDEVDGTPSAGSSVPIVNLNLGSTRLPSVEGVLDSDITGLSQVNVIRTVRVSAVDTDFLTIFEAGLIIPQGRAVAVRRTASTGIVRITAAFGEQE